MRASGTIRAGGSRFDSGLGVRGRRTGGVSALVGLLLGIVGALSVFAQEAASQPASASAPATQSAPSTQAASMPASAPVENPRRTPRRMMQHFRSAAPGMDQNPSLVAAAVACLDVRALDAETVAQRGPDYARQLADVLDTLEALRIFDPNALPDEPAAETQLIGRDPCWVVLEREKESAGAPRGWVFSSSTVKMIPEMHAGLAALRQAASAPASAPVETPATVAAASVHPQRSPWAMVTNFQIAVSGAAVDPARYAEALACLDFALVRAEIVEERGPLYADQLDAILQGLASVGLFSRDDLPDERIAPSQTIGQEPLLLIVVRKDDGLWRFSAATVARVPDMYARLTESLRQLRPAAPEGGESGAEARAAAPEAYRSPRATMRTFLKAMEEGDVRTAVRCLDFSGFSEIEREANARRLTGKLLMVLYRHKAIVLQDIPDAPDFRGPYRHIISQFGRVEIARMSGGEREGEWLFSAATVRSIERLYDAWESRPLVEAYRDRTVPLRLAPSLWLRERIPPGLKVTRLLYQDWQWLALLTVLLLSVLLERVGTRLLPAVLRTLLRIDAQRVDAEVVRRAARPLAKLAIVATWWAGIHLFDFNAATSSWIWWALAMAGSVLATIALLRLIDLVADNLASGVTRQTIRIQDVVLPLAQKTLKVVTLSLAAVLLLGLLGVRVEPLLAGLGIGGLAFGLAAQDTLRNFIASINVVLDRPFQIGDHVKIGDIEGRVESVGLRSVRVRTWYDSLVTVPNADLMSRSVDNLGRRRYRRVNFKVPLAGASSTDEVEAFCEGVRELLRRNPRTRRDVHQVSVYDFGANAIEIQVNCYLQTDDYNTELAERHKLFLDIIRLAERLDVSLAGAPRRQPGEPASGGRASPAERGRAAAAGLLGESGPDAAAPPRS